MGARGEGAVCECVWLNEVVEWIWQRGVYYRLRVRISRCRWLEGVG